MTTFFTADTHFGHLGAMKKFRRPFQDVREMNETLIRNWNSVVKPTDWVFHLGDFGKWAGVNLEQVFNLLNGTKVLIVGNHDAPETSAATSRHSSGRLGQFICVEVVTGFAGKYVETSSL